MAQIHAWETVLTICAVAAIVAGLACAIALTWVAFQ